MNGKYYDFKDLFSECLKSKLNFLNETKIFNELQNHKKIIIFDFRTRSQFAAYHLENSINLPVDEVSVEDLEKVDENTLLSYSHNKEEAKPLLSKYKRLFVVLIFPQKQIKKRNFVSPNQEDYEETLRIAKVITFYKTLVTNKIRELGIYIKGFGLLDNSFGFALSHQQKFHITKNVTYPSALFSTKIFVGNQHQALSEDILSDLKITHIVNATKHLSNKYEDKGIKYITVPVEDNDTNSINSFFKQTFDFIEEALNEGKLENGETKSENNILNISELLEKAGSNQFVKAEIMDKAFKSHYFHTLNNNRILIHCSLGVSRSSTIAIMYIMMKFSIPLKEAMNFVQFQKESSSPINCFVYELEELEKQKW